MLMKERGNARGWLRGLLWMVPLMGGISGLFARTLAEMPYVENVRRGVPVDTTKKAGRAYVDVADGPNVYKVRINAAVNVLFNDDFVSPDTMLRNAMCDSLTENFDELQKAHEMVGPFTVRILYDDGSLMPGAGGTTEADLQAVEQAVREGVREAVSKLSLSYPPELVREVLRLNVAYGVASRERRPAPSFLVAFALEEMLHGMTPSDTIIGPDTVVFADTVVFDSDTVVFDSDTIVVEKGKRMIVY